MSEGSSGFFDKIFGRTKQPKAPAPEQTPPQDSLTTQLNSLADKRNLLLAQQALSTMSDKVPSTTTEISLIDRQARELGYEFNPDGKLSKIQTPADQNEQIVNAMAQASQARRETLPTQPQPPIAPLQQEAPRGEPAPQSPVDPKKTV